MVTDIDAAKDHVHVLFYIWLPDHNGCKVVDALKELGDIPPGFATERLFLAEVTELTE